MASMEESLETLERHILLVNIFILHVITFDSRSIAYCLRSFPNRNLAYHDLIHVVKIFC